MPYKDKHKRAAHLKIRLEKKQKFIRDLKSKPCSDCGVSYHYAVMDFDHVGKKSFQISDCGFKSIREIGLEVSNCDLVCANCHRMRTFKRSKEFKQEKKEATLFD